MSPTSSVAALPGGQRLWRGGTLVALAVVLAVVPHYATPYTNQQISLILTYAVALVGLDVLIGHTGQVSLGQSAFFGLGAYTTAYGVGHGWTTPVALLAAVALATAIGAIAAVPAVRLRGFSFGILTLALPVVAVPLADRLPHITGASQGLSVVTVTAPSGLGLADDQWRVYVLAAVAAVSILLMSNVLDGRIGRALAAIRVRRAMATAMGVPILRYEALAFSMAAMCAGVAGWMYIVAVQFISPDALQLSLSVSLLVALVVGGLRSPLGNVIGAAFLVLVPSITDKISPGRSYLVYGVCLLVVLFFFPGGVAGALRMCARRAGEMIGGSRRQGIVPTTPTEEV